jgi:hypothetical protein
MIMATRKTPAASAESPLTRTDTPVDYTAFVKPSGGLNVTSRSRASAANPLAGYVARTLDEGALAIPVQNSDQAKEVTNYLRRDQTSDERVKSYRLSIQYQDGKGKTVGRDQAKEVHFLAHGKRTQRKYTAKDIREWAKGTHWGEVSGPIPAELRSEFKAANGYDQTA